MKTERFIPVLLLPLAMVACTNDELMEGNFGEVSNPDLIENLELSVSFDVNDDNETRGTFAGSQDKGLFKNFYFEPEWSDANSDGTIADDDVILPTNNGTVYGDQVGICLPYGADGGVATNVPFYIAGYETQQGTGQNPYRAPLSLWAASTDFYQISGEGTTSAFESANTQTTYGKFAAAATKMASASPALTAGDADISKAVFKAVSGVMPGKYVLYYPFNSNVGSVGATIPAITLLSVQTQTTVSAAPTTDHILNTPAKYHTTPVTPAKNNLFAYAETPFQISGAGNTNAAQGMKMVPAAYFFQFNIYSVGTAVSKNITKITVTTADNAKAFATKGYVKAGDTNTFIANATDGAVDFIAVVNPTKFNAPTLDMTGKNDEQKKALVKSSAFKAYLSTYPIETLLAGKDIIVTVYADDATAMTFNKTGLGSEIVSGETDFWNLELTAAGFKPATRVVTSPEEFQTEVVKGGDVVLKNNITLTADLELDKDVNVTGDYTITVPSDVTFTLKNTGANNTTKTYSIASSIKVAQGGTLNVGGVSNVAATFVKITNEGTVDVCAKGTLNATEIDNVAAIGTAARLDVEVNATLKAADVKTANGYTASGKTYLASVVNAMGGAIADTKFTNKGQLNFSTSASTLGSTVEIVNEGLVDIDVNVAMNGTKFTNKKTVDVAADAIVDITGSTVTNNSGATVTNGGTINLLGATAMTNSGIINDNSGKFGGLSRLTNAGTESEFIRKVTGATTWNVALGESKVTGILVSAAINESAVAISTTKTIYLNSDLSLSTAESSTVGKIVVGAGAALTGKITAAAIDVNAALTVKTTSNIYVNGTIALKNTLTAETDSYVSCADMTKSGSGAISGAGTVVIR